MRKYLLFFSLIALGALVYLNHEGRSTENFTIEAPLDVKKLTGAEKFAQLHANLRKSPEGSPYNYKSGYQTHEYQKLKKRMPESHSRDLVWEERGPGNVSGRTRAIWLDPSDSSGETWYTGSAQGGVWKTEDAGESYVLTSPDIPHMGTAAIMGCNSSPNVIYAGSGEGFNTFSAAGAGIFKTVDGGVTWTVLESTTNNESFANVMRIAVHPDNPDVVLAATRNNNTAGGTDGFVMRSKDGGETWEEVLHHFDIIPHIVMSPDDGDVIYAGLNQEGVLKTVDGGDNWDFVWLFETPTTRPERIEIAISPSDPNYVYFTTPINDPLTSSGDKIFVSDNAGESFEQIIPNDDKDDYSGYSGGQSFWNKAIAVDPFNPLKVYFAGQSAMLSLDVTLIPGLAVGELSVISDGYGTYSEYYETSTKGVHVDHHGIVFSVVDSANQEVIMINSNDGGVAVSRDMGATFKQTGDTFLQGFNPEGGQWETTDGYNVSTFYGVDKMNGADRYVGGTQDNGSWTSPENPDAASRWSYAPSGDGFEAAWNYTSPNQVIESSQFNSLHRSDDGGEMWYELDRPGFGPFVTTIANSKQDGDMVMVSTFEGPALSNDFGLSWKVSSVPPQYEFNSLRMPIRISLANPNVVWTGSGVNGNSRICLSRDGGQTFAATSDYTEQLLGEVAGIATHPANDETAYALFGAAGQPKVIRTTNGGDSWEDISGFQESMDGTSSRGFPDVAVFSLLVMPYDTSIIWVGTEIGIVQSLDDGESWNLLDDDLPATAIWEMKVINDEVVVATHGRGIWTTTLDELDGYEPPAPYLVTSKFEGEVFDKKVTGVIRHLTPIDSGMVTVNVDIGTEILTRNYTLGEVLSPSEEEINLDLEDFDIGDIIYEAEISITSYRGEEMQSRTSTYLFYDVDADDPVEDYNNDFDTEESDFAVGMLSSTGPDFSMSTPNGFDNNGLESNHNFGGSPYRAILQKPIIIPATGSTLSFDEIVFLDPAFDFGFGLFYQESIVLEATNNRGQSWVRIAEYSSEAHSEWEDQVVILADPTSDLYRKRKIVLSDYFDEGDEVYFKLEMVIAGFSFSWGYIMDNLIVESTVGTKEQLLEQGISTTTYQNPFDIQTRVSLTHPNGMEVGSPRLIDMKGQTYPTSIRELKTSSGRMYDVDGSGLASGIYFLQVRVGQELVTEKIVKM